MNDATVETARLEQALKIVQSYADATRKQREVRLAPGALAFAGMTAGAAPFAAGIAFSRFSLS
jgi:hypothetical protein